MLKLINSQPRHCNSATRVASLTLHVTSNLMSPYHRGAPGTEKGGSHWYHSHASHKTSTPKKVINRPEFSFTLCLSGENVNSHMYVSYDVRYRHSAKVSWMQRAINYLWAPPLCCRLCLILYNFPIRPSTPYRQHNYWALIIFLQIPNRRKFILMVKLCHLMRKAL